MNTRAALRLTGALAVIMTVAACGSSTGSVQPVGTTAATVDLGPNNPATGAPVKIGFVTDGKTPAVDNTPEAEAAQAAATYVNGHLGGINGHPVEIEVCETKLTPSGAADCASKMVAEKVPVVLGGTPGVVAPLVTGLEAAGIPYFVHTAADQAAILSPDAYALGNVLGIVAGPVALAERSGVKKTATIIVDVPAAIGPVKALAGPLYEEAGISNEFAAVPVGTPDMTPQVQAALNNGAEMFTIVGDPPFCTAGLGALNTLGFTGTRFINSQCLSKDLASTVPGGLDGVVVGSLIGLDPKDPEVATYASVMATYAPQTEPFTKNAREGYAITLAFVRAMTAGLKGDLSPDSVKAAFAAAGPQPLPLLSGQTFNCNRTLYKLTPSVCSTGMSLVTLDAAGNPKASEIIDTRRYFEPGS